MYLYHFILVCIGSCFFLNLRMNDCSGSQSPAQIRAVTNVVTSQTTIVTAQCSCRRAYDVRTVKCVEI